MSYMHTSTHDSNTITIMRMDSHRILARDGSFHMDRIQGTPSTPRTVPRCHTRHRVGCNPIITRVYDHLLNLRGDQMERPSTHTGGSQSDSAEALCTGC